MKRTLTTFLLLCVALAAHAGDGTIRKRPGAIQDRYIVVFETSVNAAGAHSAAAELARTHGAKVLKVWTSALKGFVAIMPEGRAKGMSHDPRIAFIEEDSLTAQSTVIPTNFDPSQACDPAGAPGCPSTSQNQLWYLDRIEQNSPDLNNRFGYCSTGQNVAIYVVDTGVEATHSEFWLSETNTASRVLAGYNAAGAVPSNINSVDTWPANNPCNGYSSTNTYLQYGGGHGTSVASVAAGRKVGVARSATIIPVKVAPCNGTNQTNAMITDGVDWILRVRGDNPNNPNDGNPFAYRDANGHVWLSHPAVATFSTYSRWDDTGVGALEMAVNALTDANITVTASANNQNDNACNTTPARLSRGNYNPALRGKVITVGGAQINNSPLGLPVGSGTHNPAQPARDARWICDSAVDDTPCSTGGIPTFINAYYAYTAGSNWGECVSLFVPSRNITAASLAGDRAYRTGMGASTGVRTYGSGTSFAAPIVAGAAARYLQGNPTASPDAVYAVLTTPGYNAVSGQLDWSTLGAGSPNLFLRLGDIQLSNPTSIGVDANGNATLSVTASTSFAPITYQWYEVTNPTYVPPEPEQRGWVNKTLVGTNSNTLTVAPNKRTSYFVRALNNCCEADSDVATVFARPGTPQNVTATSSPYGNTVTVQWTPADDKAEFFDIYRQTTASGGMVYVGGAGAPQTQFSYSASPDQAHVVQVVATAGYATSRPASSPASGRDLAVTIPWTDQPVLVGDQIKAVHVTDVRRAVNALCDYLGTARIYSSAQTLYTSLQGVVVDDTHWTELQTHINNMRTNPAIGVGAWSFSTIGPGVPIQKIHVDNLRDSVK